MGQPVISSSPHEDDIITEVKVKSSSESLKGCGKGPNNTSEKHLHKESLSCYMVSQS